MAENVPPGCSILKDYFNGRWRISYRYSPAWPLRDVSRSWATRGVRDAALSVLAIVWGWACDFSPDTVPPAGVLEYMLRAL